MLKIVFKKCLSVKNAEGRFAPTYDENDTITIQCDRVIFAVGQASVWGDLVKNEKVEFNGPAIAAGKIAAESLHRYVHDTRQLSRIYLLVETYTLDQDSLLTQLQLERLQQSHYIDMYMMLI